MPVLVSASDRAPLPSSSPIRAQTAGTPTVAVSTLVMAGSLVQVPTVAAAAGSAATRDGRGDNSSGGAALRAWRRFRVLVGVLHVVCRLVVVSYALALSLSLPTIPRSPRWCGV